MQLVYDVLDGGGRRPNRVVRVAVKLRVRVASLLVVLLLVLLGRLFKEFIVNKTLVTFLALMHL